jgi:hypothetical protein
VPLAECVKNPLLTRAGRDVMAKRKPPVRAKKRNSGVVTMMWAIGRLRIVEQLNFRTTSDLLKLSATCTEHLQYKSNDNLVGGWEANVMS